MHYFVNIDMDNAAFEDAPGAEVARILRELATLVEGYDFKNPRTTFPVRDVNGNRCGTHGYDDDGYDDDDDDDDEDQPF